MKENARPIDIRAMESARFHDCVCVFFFFFVITEYIVLTFILISRRKDVLREFLGLKNIEAIWR